MATPLPCLVLEYGDQRPTTLYGAADRQYRPCEMDTLLSKRNWTTEQGWVLACDTETFVTFLWDPQDPEHGRIKLPSLTQPPPECSACALSGDPTGVDGCTVVIVSESEDTVLWYCHVGSAATAEWARHEYDLGGKTIVLGEYRDWVRTYMGRLTACHGKFYYMISENRYGVLEFSPELVWSTVKSRGDKNPFPSNGYASFFLLDLDGELHKVWMFHPDAAASADSITVSDIAVYKLGFAGTRSVKVDSIGDRAILATLSGGFAAWCSASKFGLQPNSVYWTSSPTDKWLRRYDIVAQTEELWDCEDAAELSRLPFWLAPVHRNK